MYSQKTEFDMKDRLAEWSKAWGKDEMGGMIQGSNLGRVRNLFFSFSVFKL